MIDTHKLKKRDLYLNKIISFQDTELVKVVTGIRRCGKSSLLKLMVLHLKESDITDEQILEKQRKRFRGTYNHSLDGKGRLVIPLAFRQELGERFVIAPEFDFKSIAIYPEMVFMRLCEHYERLNRKKKNAQLMNYMQWFNSMSYTDQECDAQGRVLLPAKLRSMMLGEEKDVDIMGNDDHLRVAATINNMANFELFKDNLNATWAAIDELEDGEDEKE